jgi:hypothetical protein
MNFCYESHYLNCFIKFWNLFLFNQYWMYHSSYHELSLLNLYFVFQIHSIIYLAIYFHIFYYFFFIFCSLKFYLSLGKYSRLNGIFVNFHQFQFIIKIAYFDYLIINQSTIFKNPFILKIDLNMNHFYYFSSIIFSFLSQLN